MISVEPQGSVVEYSLKNADIKDALYKKLTENYRKHQNIGKLCHHSVSNFTLLYSSNVTPQFLF